jgi:hypothetical protein
MGDSQPAADRSSYRARGILRCVSLLVSLRDSASAPAEPAIVARRRMRDAPRSSGSLGDGHAAHNSAARS